MKKVICLGLLTLLSGFLPLKGQDVSGNIGGTILDPSGASIVNAKVTITNTDRSQVVRSLTTDATGSYSATLPVGHLLDQGGSRRL